jgi:hypothetical protein
MQSISISISPKIDRSLKEKTIEKPKKDPSPETKIFLDPKFCIIQTRKVSLWGISVTVETAIYNKDWIHNFVLGETYA